MKLYHKAFLYRHKWIQPYLQKVLGGIDAVTFLAALALIGGVVYEHGFIISEGAEADLGIVSDRMGRFPGSDHDAYRAGVSGNAEEIPDIYMGIEYFTLSDSNSRHFFRTGIGGIEIFLVIFKQPYFSADSVVVTFLIALIFGGDRTLGKTDQSLPDSGRKFLPYYLYRHRFVDVTSLYR